MKISKPTLIAALDVCGRVARKSAKIPSLQSVRVTPLDGRAVLEGAVLEGTDLDLFVRVEIPAEDVGSETFLANVPTIAPILKKLPGDTVELAWEPPAGLKDGKTFLGGISSKFRFPNVPVEEFPAMPEEIPPEVTFEADPSTLLTAIRQVLVAVADSDETRPVLGGIHVRRNGRFVLESTDGRRMIRRSLDVTVTGAEELDRTVPRRLWEEADRLLKKAVGPVTVTIGEEHSSIRVILPWGVVTLTHRNLEGSFPNTDYLTRQLDTVGHRIAVPRKIFQEAIGRMALVANMTSGGRNDGTPIVVLEFHREATFGWPRLTLSATALDADVAESEETIDLPLDQLQADEDLFRVAFNPSYLLDGIALEHKEGSPNVVVMSFQEEAATRAVVLGEDPLYMLMPVRLQDKEPETVEEEASAQE